MQPRLDRRGFLTVLLSPLALSGCSIPGFSNTTASGASTIDVWYWNRSIEDQLFRDFEQRNPDITANNQKVGGDYASRLNTTLAGQAFVPDVAAMNSDIARYFSAEDQFVDLYELGAGENEDLYLDWKWRLGVTNDGKMIGFPMDTGPTGLYYRADLFEQAGLPSEPDDVTAALAEWEDYFQAGTQLQQALPDVRMTDNIPNLYQQALFQATSFYVNADDLFVGNGDQVRRAWDVAMTAQELDLAANVTPFTPDWSAAMNNGNVASFVGAVWLKQVLQESGMTRRAHGGSLRRRADRATMAAHSSALPSTPRTMSLRSGSSPSSSRPKTRWRCTNRSRCSPRRSMPSPIRPCPSRRTSSAGRRRASNSPPRPRTSSRSTLAPPTQWRIPS